MGTANQAMFDDSQTFTKKRPGKLTEEQEYDFFYRLAQEVSKNGWSDMEVDDIAKDLQELSTSDSGFEMAKTLDNTTNCDYDFKGDFIDWLDNIHYRLKKAIEENVKKWVQDNNIKPKWEVRTKLLIKQTLSTNYMLSKNTVIFITSINEELAQYRVDTDFYIINRYYPFDYEIIEENCEVIEEEQE